jgi:hypothetical protein
MRQLIIVMLILGLAPPMLGQSLAMDSTAAISYTRSVSVPLNAYQLFDKAMDAWTWTFGREPGASLRKSDRNTGTIEGVARTNFRSEMLVGREESMGVISYRIVVQVQAGVSRITVSELTHTGNRKTPRGGIHLGALTRGAAPTQRVPGLSRANAQRLYAEVKTHSNERINDLLLAFEARLRAAGER